MLYQNKMLYILGKYIVEVEKGSI